MAQHYTEYIGEGRKRHPQTDVQYYRVAKSNSPLTHINNSKK